MTNTLHDGSNGAADQNDERQITTCAQKSAEIAFYFDDFLRITFTLYALMGEWFHQLGEIDDADLLPSKQAQKTWIGLAAFIAASTSGVIATGINYRARAHYPAAQDVFAIPFLTSYLYFLFELVGITPMRLGLFIASNAICVPPFLYFFLKFKTKDSANQIVMTRRALDALQLPTEPNIDRFSRVMNALRGDYYVASMLLMMTSVIVGETEKETKPLAVWQIALIASAMIPTLKIGYDLSEHPKRFYVFAAIMKGLREAALMTKGFSGFFYTLAVYAWCRDQRYCLSQSSEYFLTAMSLVMVTALALFSAATTQFDFKRNQEKNAFLKNCHSKTTALFSSAKKKITACCAQKSNESDSLIQAIV